jgi:hypothetical protein
MAARATTPPNRSQATRRRGRLAPISLVTPVGQSKVSQTPTYVTTMIDQPQVIIPAIESTQTILFDNVIVNENDVETELQFTVSDLSPGDSDMIEERFSKFRAATDIDDEGFSCEGLGTFCLINATFDRLPDSLIGKIRFTAIEMSRLLNAVKYVFKLSKVDLIFRRYIYISDLIVDGLEFRFTIGNALTNDMARIIKTMLTKISSMAISSVNIIENTTGFLDEEIFNRITSLVLDSESVEEFAKANGIELNLPAMIIPIEHQNLENEAENGMTLNDMSETYRSRTKNKLNVKEVVLSDDSSSHNVKATRVSVPVPSTVIGPVTGVQYALDVENKSRPVVNITGKDLMPETETLGVIPIEYRIPDGTGSTIVVPQQPGIKLFNGRNLKLTCIATLGTQEKYSIWGVVSRLGFRDGPRGTFIVGGYLRGNLSLEMLVRLLIGIINQSDDLRIQQ